MQPMKLSEKDGSHSVINEVTRGGSIDSLLSVLNVLSGNPSIHETTEAIALDPSIVLKLPARSFLEICQPQTPAFLRILQMITIRLQRLITVAIQNHLGISSELIRRESICTLTDSKAQACLQSLHLQEACPSTPDIAGGLPSDLADLKTVFLKSRGSLHPMDSVCMEVDTRGKIIDDFDSEADQLQDHPHRLVRGGLESGEVPSLVAKDKPAFLPSAITSTSTTSTSFSGQLKSLGPTQIDQLPVSSLGAAEKNQSDSPPSSTEPGFVLSKETESQLVEAVVEDIVRLFGLADSSLLQGHVFVGSVPSGTVLLEACTIQTELYYIVSGELHGFQSATDAETDDSSDLIIGRPGDVLGLLGLVTGEPNGYELRAVKNSIVATLSREHFYAMVRQNPETLLIVVRLVCARISPVLHQLDIAIQWLTVLAGRALYKKGDASNHVYIVLSGRLRQVDSLPDGGHRIIGESGRGDMVGFLEVICSQNRLHTVIAIRDSEVAQIPAFLLHYLKHKVPRVLNRIIQLLSGRLLGNLTAQKSDVPQLGLTFRSPTLSDSIDYNVLGTAPKTDSAVPQPSRTTMSNLRTIAILPTTSSINAEAFTLELQHSLTPIGSSVRLTSHIIRRRLGPSALATVNQYRLTAWLSHQEDSHRIVFFVCDYTRTSAWNRLCIRQADCVLVLALGNSDPSRISPIELTLRNHPTKVVKALVLMYPFTTDYPKQRHTAKWLNVRPWISHHYHVRCEPRVFTARAPEDLVAFYGHVFARERPNPLSDFSRLARYLTGEAIGLVLGGGGARGCAHIGVIRAFQEAGIPIDLIGGTSIGAFMSALWAEETRYAQFTQRARVFTTCFASIWNKVKDFTYPAVSIFSGKEFNEQLKSVFKDRQVEDLWIPSFYVTTDITNCRMRVHTHGSLWRYVRASMSLSGYLPPLCDPYDGCLLLDGGYTNNVPADTMSAFGAKTIFAVDVGATVDTDFSNYGDHLSGWRLLYNRFFGTNKSLLRVPNLSEIQARLAYISCVRQLEHVKASGICRYLRPPIDHYMTLQFTAFEEILTVGYEYAKQVILEWHKDDVLRQLVPGLRPNLTFDQLSPKVSPAQTPHRLSDVPRTVSNWLTQPFDDQRGFVDLAETVGTSADHRSQDTVDSSSVSDTVDYLKDGTERSRGNRRYGSVADLFGRHIPPFLSGRANPVDSLSRTFRDYFYSAKHLVSRTFPDTGLFRRRALSDNLCMPSDSSVLDSSDDPGHFSDAQDYPGQDNQFASKRNTAGYLHRTGSHSAPGHQLNSSNNFLMHSAVNAPTTDHDPNTGQHVSADGSPNLADMVVSPDDPGYLEDSEGNDDLPLQYSDPEFQCRLSHVSGRLTSHRLRRRSSLNRIRSRKFR
ncbi:patatin-like phospholipase domain-containing protein 7 [Clonorchis sinensis]|uniref:Patatin-like phospholipase domain-containing protein 7 n=1 Tax=Clonorchis sinensis TaxID=79923 RepID=H2KVD7_CLOSI|nr:patatin-like phospholipase domain-containing protein 7 [Clonorchis sinensis]